MSSDYRQARQTSFLNAPQPANRQPNLLAESRQRMQTYGVEHLSPVELLSVLTSQDAGQMWSTYRSLSAIAQAPWRELTALSGIGQVAAARIQAALELSRRLVQEEQGHRPQVTSPQQAANLLMADMRDLDQEHLQVLLLNTKNYVLEIKLIYIGNVNSSIVRACEVLRPAVRINATSIIIVHNHPSGDPTPSPEDIEITSCIVDAGKLLGIEVLDHLIIGHNRYVSLKERGVAFD